MVKGAKVQKIWKYRASIHEGQLERLLKVLLSWNKENEEENAVTENILQLN